MITIQSRLNSLEVNNYKNFSLVYAAYKREIYVILRFLLSIKQSYVGSLSRYDTSVLSHSKK